ncbi:MAG: epoxide hydrolase [Chloroflexi bacterium RBG_16_68_14]|nr:MAG: epoxide hydrolase [Chloroflexi bacterium RBG_16_68_14]
MADITHLTIEANGIAMHIAEQGEGPLVVLLHGFPESWYSWRHQLPALAAAGYHAVAPDLRGYGHTDAPEAIESYSMRNMTADVVGLLDALGESSAVVVGHDWGAPIAWNCAILYPQRVRAVVGMSVPFFQRGPMPPTQLFKQVFADSFFYILYFQEPGVAEAELEADVRRTMRMFLYAVSGDAPPGAALSQKPKEAKFLDGMPEPEQLPSWLTEEDLDYFVSELERTGFRGGLDRYRNMDRDWEELPQLAGAKVSQPALFIAGDRDPVLSFTSIDAMKEHVPDLRDVVLLPGCGHWTQQERPAEVNAALIEFLRGLE